MMTKAQLSELLSVVDSWNLSPPKDGDYCDLSSDNNQIVVFYRKTGEIYMTMSLEDFSKLKYWD